MAQSVRNRWCSRQGRRVSARRSNDSAAGRGAGPRAAARWRSVVQRIRFLAGRDTRESGAWIERELAFGIRSQGGTLTSAGIIPTPAVAYLTPRMDIHRRRRDFRPRTIPSRTTASRCSRAPARNSPKRSSSTSKSIMADTSWTRVRRRGRGRSSSSTTAPSTSVTCATSCQPTRARRHAHRDRLRQRRDDHGRAASVRASSASTCSCIGCQPDGRNINLRLRIDGAGAAGAAGRRGRLSRWASHSMATATARSSLTQRAQIVDGDAVMLMCAKQHEGRRAPQGQRDRRHGHEQHRPRDRAARKPGIDIVRCPSATSTSWRRCCGATSSLGGEQSGHVIFSDYLFTGDGLATALNVLRTMARCAARALAISRRS